MKIFLDSSAFAKRHVEEKGSRQVDELCTRASELSLSVICVPEIISALNLRRREKLISLKEYTIIKQHLMSDVRDAIVIHLTAEVAAASVTLLEASSVRAMDAFHVASALEWGANLFASPDPRQLAAARKAGLKTKYV